MAAPAITIGDHYLAHAVAGHGASTWDKWVEALIKGTVKHMGDLPSAAEQGDCWYVRSERMYLPFSYDYDECRDIRTARA